jgi:hypothetical protein
MESKISKNFVNKLKNLMPKDTESVIQTSMASNEIGEETKEEFKAPKVSMFSDEANKYKFKSKEKLKGGLSDNKLSKMETKEATSSSSSGSYESPSFLAKSTSKKDWRGASKTQIPGGKFVSIKKKCNKFPYCNQGDIKALNLYENPSVNEAIKRISVKYGISENVIKSIIQHEYENIQSKHKK